MTISERNRKILFIIILILSILGLGFAIYQSYEHYFLTESGCDFSKTISCSIVTQSSYGEFPQNSGIAVALYGVVWWGILILLFLGKRKIRNWVIWSWLTIGILSIAYLIFIELYLLPKDIGFIAICPFCTVQHALIIILLVLSFFVLREKVGNQTNL